MAFATNYLENLVANVICRGSSYTGGNVYVALYSGSLTDTGSGTEVSGTGYSRQQVSFTAPDNGVISNTANITFTASSGSYTASAMAIVDASSGGNLLFYRNITPKTVDTSNNMVFETGKITITID